MDGRQLLLLAACVLGVVIMVVGWVHREKRIRNEHWLWRKRRLRRARFMLNGGGTVSALSAVALFMI